MPIQNQHAMRSPVQYRPDTDCGTVFRPNDKQTPLKQLISASMGSPSSTVTVTCRHRGRGRIRTLKIKKSSASVLVRRVVPSRFDISRTPLCYFPIPIFSRNKGSVLSKQQVNGKISTRCFQRYRYRCHKRRRCRENRT